VLTIEALPPYQRAIAKGHLGACGISYNDLKKPIIAVVNSWNDIVSGHCHLREVAEEVKRGIREAGGTPLEFNTIAMCDGIAMGHRGMKFVLPSREIIANSIETMILGHNIFDGMVLIGSCDKIVPAMLMAAARLDIPSIMVTGGVIRNYITPAESKETRYAFIRGEVDEKQLVEVTKEYLPSAGICPVMGTANTMCIIAETLGITLPLMATMIAQSDKQKKLVRQSGHVILDLVHKHITARKFFTQAAFENAMTVASAIGGSPNTFLHIPAIAAECGLTIKRMDYDRISHNTPLITRVYPNGKTYTVADLDGVGGVPVILKELLPKLHENTPTVNGNTLYDNVKNAPNPDGTIVKTMKTPFQDEGGLAVLQGNLAKDGGVIKISAVPKEKWAFRGPAKVFESEEDCMEALDHNIIQEGDVVIVRNEGPKGGPGMREMHRVTEVITKVKNTALLTDGRFSGHSAGLAVGYLSPEAADKGPIAYIHNGDMISIDIEKRRFHWEITQEEENKRHITDRIIVSKEPSKQLRLYREQVTAASNGAILHE